jgi:hypothetical protein
VFTGYKNVIGLKVGPFTPAPSNTSKLSGGGCEAEPVSPSPSLFSINFAFAVSRSQGAGGGHAKPERGNRRNSRNTNK